MNEVALAEKPSDETSMRLPAANMTPMQMLQIAIEKNAGLEMVSKLMDLQDRWEKSEALKAFTAAMNDFKAMPLVIEKNKTVSFGTRGGDKTQYDHATLDHICEVIGKAMSQHGLSFRWDTAQEQNLVKVTCIVTHVVGHSERVTLVAGPDTSGSKNAIQALGSAITYLQRYTLMAATGLAAKDADDDGAESGERGGAIPAPTRADAALADLIPVPLVEQGGSTLSNWPVWGNDIISAVGKLHTATEIGLFIHNNEAALANCAERAPRTYNRIDGAIQQARSRATAKVPEAKA